MSNLGVYSIFFFFGTLKLTITGIQYFYLRETIHLTDKEKKTVYLPRRLKLA